MYPFSLTATLVLLDSAQFLVFGLVSFTWPAGKRLRQSGGGLSYFAGRRSRRVRDCAGTEGSASCQRAKTWRLRFTLPFRRAGKDAPFAGFSFCDSFF